MEQLQAATPEGSRGQRLSLAFVGFAVGVQDIGGRVLEDGVVLMCTAHAWQALRAALAARETFTLPPTVGSVGLQLDWVTTRYVSPVDGSVCDASSGEWRMYYPPAADLPLDPGCSTASFY